MIYQNQTALVAVICFVAVQAIFIFLIARDNGTMERRRIKLMGLNTSLFDLCLSAAITLTTLGFGATLYTIYVDRTPSTSAWRP